MPQNTLYNYFNRSPAPGKREGSFEEKSKFSSPVRTPISNAKKLKTKSTEKKKIKDEESKEEPELESPPHKKRRRILEDIESEEDSGDEYVPENLNESEDEISSPAPSSDENVSASESDNEYCISDNTKTKRIGKNNKSRSENGKSKSLKSDNSFSITNKESSTASDESWPHLKLDFMQPDKLRDIQRRLTSDPNYDPRTLYIPEEFKKRLTPAVRQWWEMKSKYFDVILFFKVGKFYELYHMDAVVAAKELNLTFMRGEFAHVGFPEIAYGRFSSTLVEKGYKIARVEQTETPDMMLERCKKMAKCTKFDKVVNREICQITSRGTRTFNVLDGESKEAESHFLLAVAEKEISSDRLSYGVCFVDTSIGIFHLGQFNDDRHCSRLRTLIAHYPPVQILYEKGSVSQKTQKLFDTVLSGILKEPLQSDNEFWSSTKTLLMLAEKEYFQDGDFPENINKFIGEKTTINTMVSEDKDLGIRALGAVVWYLKRSLLDHQLISLGQFVIYKPVDDSSADEGLSSAVLEKINTKHMILDAVTLKNLNVLENSNGSLEGTLFMKLNHCCTPFGKRLLYHWICNPLTDIKAIQARQEAIISLRNSSILSEIRSLLSQLPDLERLLSKIHSQGSSGLKSTHPDARAIMFEEKTYSKRKIIDFISTLNGFKVTEKTVKIIQGSDVVENSTLIARYCNSADQNPSGLFPDLMPHLNYFENAFDHVEAQKNGCILPKEGVDCEYDEVMETLKTVDRESKKYLSEQCEYFGTKISYYGSAKNRFQLEVPESYSKRAGSGYELQSQKKGYRRYMTQKTKEFLERIIAAEEQKVNVLKNMREKIFAQFSARYNDWSQAVQCLSVLDVLISLAEYSNNEQQVTCIPQFLSDFSCPFISLIDGRYPCTTGDETFIPNNTILGSETEKNKPNLILVTGPNMGGKSTLMRQLGLIVVMAHMGCYVPASELKLTVTDRIFTRIGANDDIMAGESTFYVELCETSSILQHATKHSIVLIDELGRGTSTFDGTAIAAAVVNYLSDVGCRTLFSTHYHSLVESFRDNLKIALGHMSCVVENDDENDCDTEETVVFLYKFAEGACPKSYGFNAARLAGMPQEIIKVARQKSKQFESDLRKRASFKMLFTVEDNEDLYRTAIKGT